MSRFTIKDTRTNQDFIYIKIRILTQIECEIKLKKISGILEFLTLNGFIPHLDFIYYNFQNEEYQAEPENINEIADIPSLSIDMRNHKLRFKYWDGSKIYWVYHIEDLFNIIKEGHNEYKKLYNKYLDITEIIFNAKKQFDDDIISVSYEYYPTDKDLDILYFIIFSKKVKENNTESKMLENITKNISSLGEEKLQDVNFAIDFDYENTSCTPCEEARRKREQNERKNAENKE